MDKIRIEEEIKDYKNCVFRYLCCGPLRTCNGCSSYPGTVFKIEEIYYEAFQEPCDG